MIIYLTQSPVVVKLYIFDKITNIKTAVGDIKLIIKNLMEFDKFNLFLMI